MGALTPRAIAQRLWKTNPVSFGRELTAQSAQRYRSAAWLRLISNLLVKAAYKGDQRIIVQAPPQHGKSQLISRWGPAWYLDRFPDRKVILASYGDSYAREWGGAVRDTIDEHQDRLRVQLKEDSKAANKWNTKQGGYMITAGLQGRITGYGANMLIVDDPVKDFADACSPTKREKAWNNYLSAARTRLQPGGSIFVLQTRWHEDDLAGRLIAKMREGKGPKWNVISLPALAVQGDPLGRAPGDALWPWRYSKEQLLALKEELDSSRIWSALYQQNPLPAEATLFPEDGWRWYDPADIPFGAFSRVIISWDTTLKDAASSDYVVGQVWGLLGGNMFLIHQVRAKMDFSRACAAVEGLYKRFPMATSTLIEDTANGPAILRHLRGKLPGLRPIKVSDSKEIRAMAIQPLFEQGRCFLPVKKGQSPEQWVEQFIMECQAFPVSLHDDQVDAFTQAAKELLLMGAPSITLDFGGLEQTNPLLS